MKNYIKFCIALLIITISGCQKDDPSALNILPADVKLISPLKNQSCEKGVNSTVNKSRLFFEWERAENTKSYNLVVVDLETGGVITIEEIYDTSKELELVHNKAYSWQIISKNVGDVTGSSPVWNFFLVGEPQSNYTPFPADIISPEHIKSVKSEDGTVTLEWKGSDPDDDNLNYTVFLDKIDGYQPAAGYLMNLSKTLVGVPVVKGETYFWRVQSSDGRNSSFTSVFTFYVE